METLAKSYKNTQERDLARARALRYYYRNQNERKAQNLEYYYDNRDKILAKRNTPKAIKQRKRYNADYYLTVTKPKRQAERKRKKREQAKQN